MEKEFYDQVKKFKLHESKETSLPSLLKGYIRDIFNGQLQSKVLDTVKRVTLEKVEKLLSYYYEPREERMKLHRDMQEATISEMFLRIEHTLRLIRRLQTVHQNVNIFLEVAKTHINPLDYCALYEHLSPWIVGRDQAVESLFHMTKVLHLVLLNMQRNADIRQVLFHFFTTQEGVSLKEFEIKLNKSLHTYTDTFHDDLLCERYVDNEKMLYKYWIYEVRKHLRTLKDEIEPYLAGVPEELYDSVKDHPSLIAEISKVKNNMQHSREAEYYALESYIRLFERLLPLRHTAEEIWHEMTYYGTKEPPLVHGMWKTYGSICREVDTLLKCY